MEEATQQPLRQQIADAITSNKVVLFMKGTPEQPRCGFSARTVAVLETLGVEFAAVDILPDPAIRQELSALSSWPTIPQLFVDGELVGGCDIVSEMYESGELAQLIGVDGAGNKGVGGTSAKQELKADGQPDDQNVNPFLDIENRLS
jgi:monothiol glutaredoxin